MAKVLAYYSTWGHIEQMAYAAAEGAREAGAEVADELWADTLGPDGSGAETYLDALALNTERIVEGLSGGEASCRPRA